MYCNIKSHCVSNYYAVSIHGSQNNGPILSSYFEIQLDLAIPPLSKCLFSDIFKYIFNIHKKITLLKLQVNTVGISDLLKINTENNYCL